MKRWVTICFLAAMAHAHGQEIAAPERPPDHLLDQTGTVTAAERAAVTAEFDLAARETGLGVCLVLLNIAPEEPPMDLARRLVARWKGSEDRAVLLAGPGMSPPMVIAVAGKSLGSAPDEQVNSMTDAALAAGAKAATGLPALLTAARSLISEVKVMRARETSRPPSPPSPPSAAAAPSALAALADNNYLLAWIAGGVLLGCVVALLLMRRGRRSAMIFPSAEFRQRFSAPHSGGNDALVFFGKQ